MGIQSRRLVLGADQFYQHAENIDGRVIQRAGSGDPSGSGHQDIDAMMGKFGDRLRSHAMDSRLKPEGRFSSFGKLPKRQQIRYAQERLKQLGYYHDAIDGIAGNNTRTALKQFQRDVGLRETEHREPNNQAALACAAPGAGQHRDYRVTKWHETDKITK